jgi:hypothetical protein
VRTGPDEVTGVHQDVPLLEVRLECGQDLDPG